MQRKRSPNTRHANANEKRFHAYTKESDCINCGRAGPSIVDHVAGATYKHNKVLIGHWFVIPLCVECDEVKTKGSNKVFVEKFGSSMAEFWLNHVINCSIKITGMMPKNVTDSIMDCGK